MKYLRSARSRGHANFGWLNSKHSFSFGQYHDPAHMGFGSLRVINDDQVKAGRGFDTHPHANMEIMTYVTHGALEHRDSMGKASIIKPGDLQVMSAGTGVSHSEFNASQTDPVHFLQIWVVPEAQGLKPSYDQRHFDDMDGKLRLLASRAGRDGSLTVHQDIDLYASRLGANETANLTLRDGRGVWVQLIKGELLVNDQAMKSGDGLALAEETHVAISAAQDAEFLLFDLAL